MVFGVNTVLQDLLLFFCSLDNILENSVLCWPVGATQMFYLLREIQNITLFSRILRFHSSNILQFLIIAAYEIRVS